MSLMSTLGKVAVGIMVAKGVGKLVGGSNASANSGGGGLGGLLGSLTGGAGGSSGGLGGLLGSLTGGAGGSSAGGLGDLLSGLSGQGGQSGGGLGGLLNSLGGGQTQAQANTNPGGSSFGDLFNTALQGNEPEQLSAEDEKNAELMLRAMISAAKADGNFDADEQKKITEHMGDISAEEAEFLRKEVQAPLDLQGLVRSVPGGMEQQVYLMSLLAISLDNQEEAVYLDQLAKGLNLSHEAANHIHDQLGAPRLYS